MYITSLVCCYLLNYVRSVFGSRDLKLQTSVQEPVEGSLLIFLTLPRIIMRLLVTRGSDILIMWVREAELRPRLALVIREP